MTRRILILSLVGVLGVSVGVFAQSAPTKERIGERKLSPSELATVRTSLATASARSLLRKQVSEVDWDEATLEDVVEWLRDKAEGKVNIIFRWTALAVEGVDRDSLVTLRLADTTVAEILVEVVDQLSPSGAVTFHGMDNRLTVSTKEDLDRKMHVRVYEVTDILFHVPDFGRSAPVVDLEQAARAGKGGGGGQSIFSGTTSSSEDLEEEEQEVEERIDQMRTLITDMIAPESWDLGDGTGSGRGRIRVFDNRYLIVRNTAEVHEELVGYFSLAE